MSVTRALTKPRAAACLYLARRRDRVFDGEVNPFRRSSRMNDELELDSEVAPMMELTEEQLAATVGGVDDDDRPINGTIDDNNNW